MNLATSYLQYNSIQTFLMKSTDHKIYFLMPNSVCIVYLWIMDFKMYFTVEFIHEKLGTKVTPQQTPNIPTISQFYSGFLPSGKKFVPIFLEMSSYPKPCINLREHLLSPMLGNARFLCCHVPAHYLLAPSTVTFLMTAPRQKPETVKEKASTWRAGSTSTRFFFTTELK